MFKKLQSIALLLVLASTTVFAQSGSVTGVITDAKNGETLPGVNIILVEINKGVSANGEGRYTISNVPSGTYSVRATFIGYADYTGSVTVGSSQVELDIALERDVFGLDEVVVTGVIEGTPKKKLAFTVDEVGGDELELVTAGNAGSALQGKVAGVKVVSATGAPGSAPSIRLRGSTALGGGNGANQEPLYIVDGVILSGSLADIPANDIESIELVKGAAAASLYGSRAANGVIQIFTKRGKNLAEGKTTVTVRNEFGRSYLPNQISLSKSHPYVNTAAGLTAAGKDPTLFTIDETNSYFIGNAGTPDAGARVLADDEIQDNAYGVVNDIQDQVFDGGFTLNNYISVARNFGNSNVALSFTNNEESGLVDLRDGYNRQNARINLDQYVSEKVTVGASLSYSQSNNDRVAQGPGSPFWSTLFLQPNSDIFEPNEENGQPYNIDVDPYVLEDNPLYQLSTSSNIAERTRVLGNLNFRYRPISQVLVEGQYSIDRTGQNVTAYTPKGTLVRDAPPSLGSLSLSTFDDVAQNISMTAGYNERFGDLSLRTKVSYLYENSEFSSFGATGNNFLIGNLRNFNALDPDGVRTLNNFNSEVISENLFGIVAFDYKDRYIFDFLIRRDGSSLFGKDERFQNYFRAATAYRISEDFEIDGINELKITASYGTAGIRPSFAAQYLTFNINGGNVSKGRLGNPDLKPALAKEFETGLNVDFLDIFSFQGAYSTTTVEDQILDVPLSAASGGYNSQFRNAGTLETNTIEASLRAIAIQERDMNLTFGVTFDRTRQKVTELNVPPYFQGSTTQGANVFFVAPGEDFGVIYGRSFVTNLNQLNTTQTDAAAGDPDFYAVNNEGYVVTGLGTSNESPVVLEDEDGNQIRRIGDINSDFNVGFNTNFTFKGFNLYMLWDAKIGGDIYNQTRQWLYRELRSGDQDQAGKSADAKKPVNYYQGFYNANNVSDYFIEDGTYLKLRELSIGYNFTKDQLGSLGQLFESVRVSAVGRNLLTISDYSGYDPEVGGIGGDASNFAFDGYSYPNFRTFSGSLELRF